MPQRTPNPLQTTLLSGEMASVNLEEIKKRYKFKEISVATWRDPRSSTLPARGGPSSPSVSADAVARPFVPTYKVSYNLPEPTDDEASEEGERDDASAVDTEEDQLLVDSPMQEPSNLDLAGEIDELSRYHSGELPRDHSGDIAVLGHTVEGEPVESHGKAVESEPIQDDGDTIVDLAVDQTENPVMTTEALSLSGHGPEDAEGGQDALKEVSNIEGKAEADSPAENVAWVDERHRHSSGHGDAEEGLVVQDQEPDVPVEPEPVLDELPAQAEDTPVAANPAMNDESSQLVPDETAVDVPTDEIVSVVEPADSEGKTVHFAPGTPEPKPTTRKKKSSRSTKHKSKKKATLPVDEHPDDIAGIFDGSHAEDVPPPVPMPPADDQADAIDVVPSAGDEGSHTEPVRTEPTAALSVPASPVDKPVIETTPPVGQEKKKSSKDKAKKKSSSSRNNAKATELVAGLGIAVPDADVATEPTAERVDSNGAQAAGADAPIDDKSATLAINAVVDIPSGNGADVVVPEPLPDSVADTRDIEPAATASGVTGLHEPDVHAADGVPAARATGVDGLDGLIEGEIESEGAAAASVDIADASADANDQDAQQNADANPELQPLEPTDHDSAVEQNEQHVQEEAASAFEVQPLETAGGEANHTLDEGSKEESASEAPHVEPVEESTAYLPTDEPTLNPAEESAQTSPAEPAASEAAPSSSGCDEDPADANDDELNDTDGRTISVHDEPNAQADPDEPIDETEVLVANDTGARSEEGDRQVPNKSAADGVDAVADDGVGDDSTGLAGPEKSEDIALEEAPDASTNGSNEQEVAPDPEASTAAEDDGKGEDQSSGPKVSQQEIVADDGATDEPGGMAEESAVETETRPDPRAGVVPIDSGAKETDDAELDQGISSEPNPALTRPALDAEKDAEPAATAVSAADTAEQNSLGLVAGQDEGFIAADEVAQAVEIVLQTKEGDGDTVERPAEDADPEPATQGSAIKDGASEEGAGAGAAEDEVVPAANDNEAPESDGLAPVEGESAGRIPREIDTAEAQQAVEAAVEAASLPPSKARSGPKSSHKHTDHWERRHGRAESSKQKSDSGKRSDRRSKDMSRTSEATRSQHSKKKHLTAEEEADRQKRREERFAREKARIEEQERRKAEEEELRRIRHEAKRAARKAAAEEAARLARQEAVRIAREDAEVRRRRRDEREREERARGERGLAKDRARSSRKRRDSVTQAPLLFRTGTSMFDRRRDDGSERTSRYSDRSSSRRRPSPKKAVSVEEPAEEEKTSSPVDREDGHGLQPSSRGSGRRLHRSRRYTGEESERPRSSRKEDGHRSGGPPIEDKPSGFFASLIRRF